MPGGPVLRCLWEVSMTRLLALLCLVAAIVFAQIAPTASLTGTITDPSGAAIPNAQIQLVNLETGFERTVKAQDEGSYRFTQIPVGIYRVEASANGFSVYRQSGVRLNVNTTTTLDIRLAVG